MKEESWGSQNKRSRISRMFSQSQCGVARSWPDLPPEILSSIGKRLETPLDVSLFRSVCKRWRSSLPAPPTSNPNPNPNPNPNSGILSPFLPLEIPNSSNLPFNNRPDESLILVASAVLHVQPIDSDPNSKGWLITVEERIAGKLRLLRPLSKSPLGIKLPSNFPNCISLFKFRVTEIAKNYSFKFASDGKDVSDIKVVLCSLSSFSDCTAMVLYGDGVLIGVRVRNGEWSYVRQSLIVPFVNVSSYDSMVCAIDDIGHVFAVDYMIMKVTNTIVYEEIEALQGKMLLVGLRSSKLNHHLLESNGELYLVVWDRDWWNSRLDEAFEFYKLNKGQRKWVSVETLGDGMLFVSPEWCVVFSNHNRIFNGKAIVYSSRCQVNVRGSRPLFEGYSVDLGGFHLLLQEMHDRDRVPSSFYRDVADMMWLPPTWFWPDAFSSSSYEEHEGGHSDFCSQHSPTCIVEVPCASEDQDSKSDASKVTFEELDIRCDLVPILQKVWAKYGNILEGSNVQSKGMLSCALESLAKVIIILEGNTGRTLTKVQCNDITSILCDLKLLSVSVEWLSPFVEKAVALHISKPMIAALAELDKAKNRAEEMKMKFSNADELVKALEKDQIRVSERMPISGPIDLDQCLAKGLF